jgi:hypothetical protein
VNEKQNVKHNALPPINNKQSYFSQKVLFTTAIGDFIPPTHHIHPAYSSYGDRLVKNEKKGNATPFALARELGSKSTKRTKPVLAVCWASITTDLPPVENLHSSVRVCICMLVQCG